MDREFNSRIRTIQEEEVKDLVLSNEFEDDSIMFPHEYIGIKYLLTQGYEHKYININARYRKPNGKADLTTTNDGQDWEVKVVSYGEVAFTYDQVLNMGRKANVLIFDKKEKLLDTVRFEEILFGRYKRFRCNANVSLSFPLASYMLRIMYWIENRVMKNRIDMEKTIDNYHKTKKIELIYEKPLDKRLILSKIGYCIDEFLGVNQVLRKIIDINDRQENEKGKG